MDEIVNLCWSIICKIVQFVLKFVFRMIHCELTDEILNTVLQFVKFGIVGVSNTVISYSVYAISLIAFQKAMIFPKYNYFLAQAIAFIISVYWSFYWNNKYVFVIGAGEKRNLWKALFKTYMSYAFTGLFLNMILLYIQVNLLHISAFIAPIFNLLISIPLNFIINKFWAFKTQTV